MFYWNVLYVCPALTELASSTCEVMSRLDNYFPHASGIACMCMFYLVHTVCVSSPHCIGFGLRVKLAVECGTCEVIITILLMFRTAWLSWGCAHVQWWEAKSVPSRLKF